MSRRERMLTVRVNAADIAQLRELMKFRHQCGAEVVRSLIAAELQRYAVIHEIARNAIDRKPSTTAKGGPK